MLREPLILIKGKKRDVSCLARNNHPACYRAVVITDKIFEVQNPAFQFFAFLIWFFRSLQCVFCHTQPYSDIDAGCLYHRLTRRYKSVTENHVLSSALITMLFFIPLL